MWTIKHDLDQSEYIRLNHFPLATSMYWQAGKTLKAAQDPLNDPTAIYFTSRFPSARYDNKGVKSGI